MAEEINEEEKIAGLHRKPNGFGKLIKAFMIAGGIAVLGGGAYEVTKLVKEKNAEKNKIESKATWEKMYDDADSVATDIESGKFYAIKKSNEEKIAKLEAQKKAIIDKANKEFIKAFKARDAEGMKKAVEAGADNINTPNDKGQTPLMQLVKEAESAKAYQAARYLISINVDMKAKDKDGATAEDYAAIHKTLKGQTLHREIVAKKDAKVNNGGNSKEIREIDTTIAEEKQKFYEVRADKDGCYRYVSATYYQSRDIMGFEHGVHKPTREDIVGVHHLKSFLNKYLE